MLKIEPIETGFRLYYKDYLILEHSSQNPCIKTGSGKAQIKSHHGHFKMKDKDVIEIQLQEYEILSQEDNKIEMTLGTRENLIKTSFSILEDRLEIKFLSINRELNRFWIRLRANEGEAIY